MGTGSPTQVDSMMIASYLSASARRFTSMRRSPRRVQQTHPFCISTSFSSVCESSTPSLMRLASTLISAISLTMSATLSHSLFSSICFKRVVLPLQRNPERTVTGISFFIIYLQKGQDLRYSIDSDLIASGARGKCDSEICAHFVQ